MRIFVLVSVLCLLVEVAPASITNVVKIQELSAPGVMDVAPQVSSDELRVVFLRRYSLTDASQESYILATRASTTDPFDNLTSAPFVNVMSSSTEGLCWMSDDGLRLYFTSDRNGTFDLFYSERASTAVPFPSPTAMGVNDPTANDSGCCLANNELSLYFVSGRSGGAYGPSSVYRATRSTISEAFGTPQEVPSVDWSAYPFMTISNDELTLLMADPLSGQVSYATRTSTAEDFTSVYTLSLSLHMSGASFNADLSKIYFSDFNYYDLSQMDIYMGDIDVSPPPTPTPSPTPSFPLPAPDIDMAVSSDQIKAYTGADANPFGAAFDSQSRLVFFDQKSPVDPSGERGTNQFLRVSLSGGTPAFETLATQAQLAAHDAQWSNTTDFPVVACIDVLSDDSIVYLAAYPSGGTSTLRLQRIVPGSTPQITTIASLSPYNGGSGNVAVYYPTPLAVDRAVTPNILYFASFDSIYRVTADQLNVNVTTPWATSSDSYVHDLAIDGNRNIVVAGANLYNFWVTRFDPTTAVESPVVTGLDAKLDPPYVAATALAINPTNGDVLALYVSVPYIPAPSFNAYFSVFRMKKNGSTYDAATYVTGYEVLSDPDVAPFGTYPPFQLTARGNSFAISPDGRYLYIGGGFLDLVAVGEDYYSYAANRSFVRIATEATTAAGDVWVRLK